MPSEIAPADPTVTKPRTPPPDVTALVAKINHNLSFPWQENERRCGRAVVLPTNITKPEVDEIMKIFCKWDVKYSNEKTGKKLSFKNTSV